jgi:ribosomal protein S7
MQDPNELLRVAINNIKPIMVLTPIKRGGVRYQVTVTNPVVNSTHTQNSPISGACSDFGKPSYRSCIQVADRGIKG